MSARPNHLDGASPVSVPDAVSERLGRLQLLSYNAICETAYKGLTAHEVSFATGFDRCAIQPRISELRRKGLVVACGKRRRNPSGKTAMVWVASVYADGDPQSPDTI